MFSKNVQNNASQKCFYQHIDKMDPEEHIVIILGALAAPNDSGAIQG